MRMLLIWPPTMAKQGRITASINQLIHSSARFSIAVGRHSIRLAMTAA